MKDNSRLHSLKTFLSEQAAGPVSDRFTLVSLLSNCWGELEGSGETRLEAYKLHRIEDPTWTPPFLEFLIERHGQTVLGSSRATVHRWRIDVERASASIVDQRIRQLYPADKRLDVGPIAQSLADQIVNGRSDPRIVVGQDGTVRLKIGEIIPETVKETTQHRRKRLRTHLNLLLAQHGWQQVRPNVYRCDSPGTI